MNEKKFCCHRCRHEFEISDIRLEMSEWQGKKIIDVNFDCPDCDEQTAFIQVRPVDLIAIPVDLIAT